MPSDYDKWDAAFLSVYGHADDPTRTPCLDCDSRTLRLIFITSADYRPGLALSAFWCDTCLRGLLPNTSMIPAGGQVVPKGCETVPSYSIVP